MVVWFVNNGIAVPLGMHNDAQTGKRSTFAFVVSDLKFRRSSRPMSNFISTSRIRHYDTTQGARRAEWRFSVVKFSVLCRSIFSNRNVFCRSVYVMILVFYNYDDLYLFIFIYLLSDRKRSTDGTLRLKISMNQKRKIVYPNNKLRNMEKCLFILVIAVISVCMLNFRMKT